jgi:hypothetical protein
MDAVAALGSKYRITGFPCVLDGIVGYSDIAWGPDLLPFIGLEELETERFRASCPGADISGRMM